MFGDGAPLGAPFSYVRASDAQDFFHGFVGGKLVGEFVEVAERPANFQIGYQVTEVLPLPPRRSLVNVSVP